MGPEDQLMFLTLKGHQSGIFSLIQLNNERIDSCYDDKAIIIWG